MKYMNELKSVIPLLADVAKHLNQEQVGTSTIITAFVAERAKAMFSQAVRLGGGRGDTKCVMGWVT